MTISALKEFSKIDVMNVLTRCAWLLECAYQETMNKEFWRASMQANIASDYLLNDLNLQNEIQTIH